MKIGRTRVHKARPVDYELVEFGASVQIDTDDPQFEGMEIDQIREDLDRCLDELLEKDVDRTLRLGGTIEESHLWDFYGID